MKNTEILDNYTHLRFSIPESIDDLSVGMMVQLIHRNDLPLRWKWVELTSEEIENIKKENAIECVRLLNVKQKVPIKFTEHEVAFIHALSEIKENEKGEKVYTIKYEFTQFSDKENIF